MIFFFFFFLLVSFSIAVVNDSALSLQILKILGGATLTPEYAPELSYNQRKTNFDLICFSTML